MSLGADSSTSRDGFRPKFIGTKSEPDASQRSERRRPASFAPLPPGHRPLGHSDRRGNEWSATVRYTVAGASPVTSSTTGRVGNRGVGRDGSWTEREPLSFMTAPDALRTRKGTDEPSRKMEQVSDQFQRKKSISELIASWSLARMSSLPADASSLRAS
jgi:hypothetical protein